MSSHWIDVLAVIGVQHLWQSALLLPLAWLVFRLQRQLGADLRSWLLLCVFTLAVLSPFVVFLPGGRQATAAVAADAPPTAQHAGVVPVLQDVEARGAAPAGRAITVDGLQALKPVAMLAWLLGFAWSLRRVPGGWLETRRLREAADPSPDLQRLLGRDLPRNVAIRVSDRIGSPMVVGLAHPCILVPRTLQADLPVAVLLDILHHELAHVRRRDLWVALGQRLCIAAYWWNPLLRFIGRQLDLLREMACDERAARRAGGSKSYARSLLASAGKVRSSTHPRHVLAVGIFDTRKALVQRIEGLTHMDTKGRASGRRPALLLCVVALAASTGLTLAATPRVNPAAPGAARDLASQSENAERLVEAARKGRLDEVRRLVRSGVDIDARVDGDGTALIQAARGGNLSLVDALLRMGADVDQASQGDGNPLIMAAKGGHLDVVERLVAAGADVNGIVPYDETPLINASRSGRLPVVRFLVERGADVNLGVMADLGRWRSPLNQARNPAVRDYLAGKGAVSGKR